MIALKVESTLSSHDRKRLVSDHAQVALSLFNVSYIMSAQAGSAAPTRSPARFLDTIPAPHSTTPCLHWATQ